MMGFGLASFVGPDEHPCLLTKSKVDTHAPGTAAEGCIAFHREAYIPKGYSQRRQRWCGGSVILQADHDLNNLIGQYYAAAPYRRRSLNRGFGKGMDGNTRGRI